MVQLAQLEINDKTGEALARVARGRGQSVDDVLRSLLGVSDEHANANNAEQAGFDRVWERIRDLAGTEFATRNGQRFSYVVDGSYVAPSTSDVRIPVSQFRKAFAIGPVRGPASFRGVFAPSIVWAVLNDPRVVSGGPGNAVDHDAAAVRAEEIDPLGSYELASGNADPAQTWPDDCAADRETPFKAIGPLTEPPTGVESPDSHQVSTVVPAELASPALDVPPPAASPIESPAVTVPDVVAVQAAPTPDVPSVLAPVALETRSEEPRGILRRLFSGRR